MWSLCAFEYSLPPIIQLSNPPTLKWDFTFHEFSWFSTSFETVLNYKTFLQYPCRLQAGRWWYDVMARKGSGKSLMWIIARHSWSTIGFNVKSYFSKKTFLPSVHAPNNVMSEDKAVLITNEWRITRFIFYFVGEINIIYERRLIRHR